MRLKLTVAYDGRPFAGWQSQGAGASVQETLEAAISELAGRAAGHGHLIRVHGSGRTDRGVHALGQVAHFDAPDGARLSELDWHRALNSLLPPTLRIMRCERVTPDFHARFHATGKIYHYRLWHGEVLPPLEHGLAWHLPGELDEALLRRTAPVFEGTHDFTCFCANRGEPGEAERSKVRTLTRVGLRTEGELLTLIFEGEGFLYKMVRSLVGALVRVARGREPAERLASLLHDPTQKKPGWQAPPDGLSLMRVMYDGLKGQGGDPS